MTDTASSDLIHNYGNWNKLPIEIKTIIVNQLDNNSRLALRACSIKDMQLVDSVPFVKIHSIRLFQHKNCWCILLKKSVDSFCKKSYKYASFDEFQEKLLEIMRYVDQVYELNFSDSFSSFGPVKFAVKREKLKVFRLICFDDDVAAVPQQIEPVTLKYVYVQSDNKNDKIYDMSQILFAEEVDFLSSSIRDDQLLKLCARDISLCYTSNITTSGVNMLLKKIVQETNFRKFRIGKSNLVDIDGITVGLDVVEVNENVPRKIVINTSSSHYQFELNFLSKCITGTRKKTVESSSNDSNGQSSDVTRFGTIELVEININSAKQVHSSIRKEKHDEKLESQHSSENLKNEVEELMRSVFYIKELRVENSTLDWTILPSFERKMRVGSLFLRGSSHPSSPTLVHFIEQIEEGVLKKITLCGKEKVLGLEIFDTKQLTLAESIHASGLCIQEEQLLKLNAFQLIVVDAFLTPSTINKLIKKWLLVLDQKDYFFEFQCFGEAGGRDPQTIIEQVLNGLDVASCTTESTRFFRFDLHYIVVNSPFPDIQFLICLSAEYVTGEKIEKNQPFIPKHQL